MAISTEDRARAEELAKELFAIHGGRFQPDGTSKTFDQLETEIGLIGSLVSSMALNQATAEMPEEQKCVRCPKCKAVPQEHNPEEDEPILIQTTYGEAQWITEGYFCRRCRRSFFPSAR